MSIARSVQWILNFGRLLVSLGVLAGAITTGAGELRAGESEVLRIAGSTTVLPIVTRASERFQVTHPSLKITVNAGGSGVGIQGASTGRVDIGLASREITPQEQTRYVKQSLNTIVIGRDAVACVVSSEVFHGGVHSLTPGQIADIYLGQITNWQQVGGPDRPILVIDKERHRGTRHVFMQYLFGDPQAKAPGARLVTGSNNEEQAKIAQSDSAIGMLSIAWMNEDVVGVGIQADGGLIQPTLDNVRNGRFPISRNLNLVTAGEPGGVAKEFVEYLLSPEGQKIVEDSGYIPIHSPQAVAPVSGH